MINSKQPKTIDEFIAGYPKNVRVILKKIRDVVKTEAPKAEEKIGYGIPTFTLNGRNLVHFSALKKHIGFYPTPSVITKYRQELSKYKTSKGSVQFPLDESIPYSLIKKMVAFRLQEVKRI